MMARLRGWLLQRWHRLRRPYEVDRGEFGERGWMGRLEPRLVNTSLSFKELNEARQSYGDLPSKEEQARQVEGMSRKEIRELAESWRPSEDPDFKRSVNRFLAMDGRYVRGQ